MARNCKHGMGKGVLLNESWEYAGVCKKIADDWIDWQYREGKGSRIRKGDLGDEIGMVKDAYIAGFMDALRHVETGKADEMLKGPVSKAHMDM